jgi:hypothetical protein
LWKLSRESFSFFLLLDLHFHCLHKTRPDCLRILNFAYGRLNQV